MTTEKTGTTEKVDLGGGEHAIIRTDLTRADRRWWYARIDEVRRGNGTGKPAYTGPDPDRPAVMKEFAAEPAYLRPEDSMQLNDELTRRLLVSWSLPEPFSAAYVDTFDLDMCDELDDAIGRQRDRLNGVAPKKTTSVTSTDTSQDTATAPLPE